MPVTIPQGQVYLDNASTSFPKPDAVAEAVAQAVRIVGLTTGRGTSFCEIDPDDITVKVRQMVARLINADDPQRVIFTYSATDSINLVLFGTLGEGDHMLVSPLDQTGPHIQALAKISRLMLDQEFKESCEKVESAEQLYELIRKKESQ